MPLTMFRRPTLTAANLAVALVFGSFFATIFQASLFMQQVLGYSPVATGAAWIGETACALVVAATVAPRMVGRWGAGPSLVIGQTLCVVGLVHLSRAPMDAAYWRDLFPGFVALGAGLGLSVLATQVAAFTGIEQNVAGLAGGMMATARELGGTLGVAVVATVAIAGAEDALSGPGAAPGAGALALTEGFHRASLVAAAFSLVAAVGLRAQSRPATT